MYSRLLLCVRTVEYVPAAHRLSTRQSL